MNKVFVFDVDGTLLTGDHLLTDCVLEAIDQIRKRDCQITIATGRSALWSAPILEELQITFPYISSGGSCIQNPVNAKVFYQRNMSREQVHELLETAYRYEIIGVCFQNIFDVVVDQGSFSYMEPLVRGLPMKKMNSLYEFVGDIVKIDIQGTIEILGDLYKEVEKKPNLFNIAGKQTTCLEITKYGINKGTALMQLCRLMDVRHEDLIVFGNGDNDIPMFDYAGFSIAMGNSSVEVKAHADIVAPSNDEEGVAWAIMKVLKML